MVCMVTLNKASGDTVKRRGNQPVRYLCPCGGRFTAREFREHYRGCAALKDTEESEAEMMARWKDEYGIATVKQVMADTPGWSTLPKARRESLLKQAKEEFDRQRWS